MSFDHKLIENVELLTDIFGEFPSFHDAEVVVLTLSSGNYAAPVTLEASIHAFEMTSEVVGNSYVRKHHTLVTFQFDDVLDIKIEDFAHQNVLQDLCFEDIRHKNLGNIKFDVEFQGVVGLDAKFRCRAIRILSAEPFTPRGPYATKG